MKWLLDSRNMLSFAKRCYRSREARLGKGFLAHECICLHPLRLK